MPELSKTVENQNPVTGDASSFRHAVAAAPRLV